MSSRSNAVTFKVTFNNAETFFLFAVLAPLLKKIIASVWKSFSQNCQGLVNYNFYKVNNQYQDIEVAEYAVFLDSRH